MAFNKAAWKEERIAQGLCPGCGGPFVASGCATCRTSATVSAQRSAKTRIQQGLCRQCGNPNTNSGPRCPTCLQKSRDAYHARAARGECVICCERAIAGAFCLHHWFKNIGSSHGFNAKNGGIALLRAIWEEQHGLCAVTNRPMTPGSGASLDHIVPTSKGGTNERSNLRWVLWEVNRAKSDMTHEQFVAMCREVVRAEDRGRVDAIQQTRSN
jgi:5-methylcytosine-specific restriction endonuclease McrA